MRKIIKYPWISIIVWAVITLLFVITMPDINKIVRQKGDPHINPEYLSQIAARLEKEYQGYSQNLKVSSIAIVFYKDKGLNEADLKQINEMVNEIEENRKQFYILDISSHFKNPELKDYFFSKNKKILLVNIFVDKSQKEIINIKDDIYSFMNKLKKPGGVEIFLTGSDLITQDFIKASQDGVKKTDIITIVFIIIVLILVFKSPVTPIVSLMTVGVSFLVSLSIVGHLSNLYDFPISTFTRSFLVVALFGIGTDYNLLLISRFREELALGKEIDEAISNTYKTAGKTVLFSCLTVLIGFSAFAAASFNFFRAMSAIAIGVFVLMLVLLTLVPAVLKIINKNLLWPFNKEIKHTHSRLWEKAAIISSKYPYVVLSTILIISLPLIFSLRGDLSFNILNELNESYKSVKGFNLISKNFSVGKTFPITIYLKTKDRMTNSNALADIEKISSILSRQKHIKEVYSVTRPKGEKIQEFMLSNQAKTVINGMDSVKNGLNQINAALDTINKQLSISTKDFEIDKLINGLNQLENGIYVMKTSLKQLNSGFEKGLNASKKVYDGIDQIYTGSTQLSNGFKKFYTEYKKSIDSVKSKFEGYDINQIDLLVTGMQTVRTNLDALSKKYPELSKDFNYILTMQIVSQLKNGVQQLKQSLKSISTEYSSIVKNIQTADDSMKILNSSLDQLANGAKQLKNAQKQIIDGYSRVDEGQKKILDGTELIYSKLKEFDKQKDDMLNKLNKFENGIADLKSGLMRISNAINKISVSMDSFKSYFEGYKGTNLFYVPQAIINSADFSQALNSYMNNNRTITKIMLIIDENPYSNQAIDIVSNVEKVLKDMKDVVDTKFISYGIGGISSIDHDLREMYFKDFRLLRTIMLIGIFILMFIISRSLVNALVMVLTIILDYYLALSITEMIFKGIFKYESLNWSVAFFSFTMLLALGIDYSVFLLIRFYEHRDLEISEALRQTSANIGHVITSAAIILAGTFAAMIPSGILSLIEVSTCVIIGLILLAFGILPLLFNSLLKIKRYLL